MNFFLQICCGKCGFREAPIIVHNTCSMCREGPLQHPQAPPSCTLGLCLVPSSLCSLAPSFHWPRERASRLSSGSRSNSASDHRSFFFRNLSRGGWQFVSQSLPSFFFSSLSQAHVSPTPIQSYIVYMYPCFSKISFWRASSRTPPLRSHQYQCIVYVIFLFDLELPPIITRAALTARPTDNSCLLSSEMDLLLPTLSSRHIAFTLLST